jgi:biotin operon repressor
VPDQPRDELLLLLRELVAWTKFQARGSLVRALSDLLSTENDRRIYELTDGSRNGTEVAGEVGVSKAAVSQKWKAWRKAGVLIESPEARGPQHLASIESLGGLPD